ncbi:MAG TPA: molybdopterin-dependent oxidoreductase [Steroidobacteraceae bacterium]|nr:molybdopterin-dependent oxidoreductase [Steroidobacteraceae bacterium]
MTTTREVTSVCRICVGNCGVHITLDEGRIAAIRGDKDHALSRGYICIKGTNAHMASGSKQRVLRPLKRQPDGSFVPLPMEQALDEIAAQLSTIAAEDGPPSIALFKGTQAYLNVALAPMLTDWMAAIGSPSFFTTMTIDQSAKYISMQRIGMWAAPRQHFFDSDVVLLAGANPLVSLSVMGLIGFNMTKQFRDAKARGLKLIVIDPRLSETARLADIHLQVRPGEDPTLLAGMLREILAHGWYDTEFCRKHVEQLDALRTAVEPFTLSYVAERAGVPAAQITAAARLFAAESRKGCANSGTGTNMVAHSNLAEHLLECLNVVCGRYMRAGDVLRNPGILSSPQRPRAEVIPPLRQWESGPKGRVRGLGSVFGEMMSATLPEEILTPGPGRIRALIVDGGNPAVAMPDQRKTVAALQALDLLVAVEPFMTATAQLAHYILPPRLMYEREDLMMGAGYEPLFMPVPFQQFIPAVVEPPPGSDVLDEWRIYWELARRMGKQIVFAGQPLDMQTPPTTQDLFRLLLAQSPLSLDELMASAFGIQADVPPVVVQEGRDDPALRFQVMPADVAAEVAAVLKDAPERIDAAFPLRLISRRMRETMNSFGTQWAAVQLGHSFNPAYMHPADMAEYGLHAGDRIEICSDHDGINAVVRADEGLRRGTVSMTHCWGDLPDRPSSYDSMGSCTARLISLDRDVETINGMPRMSAIPVNIRRLQIEGESIARSDP